MRCFKSRDTIIREKIDELRVLYLDLYDAWMKEESEEYEVILERHLKATRSAIRRVTKLLKKNETSD